MSDDPRADLHAHTTCSDGTLSPADLVAKGVEAGLAAMAVTDHDTTAGVAPAQTAAQDTGLAVVPGIEISSRSGPREIHLLGLFIDPDSAALAALTTRQREWRRDRAEVMVARAAEAGIDISMETVDAAAAGAPIGRPHIAQALVDAGAVHGTQEAFDRYIGIGRAFFVPKQMLPTVDAIGAVHDAGGVAVVAHPHSSRVRQNMLTDLQADGLDGVEVIHPRHPSRRQHLLRGLCEKLGLLPSGGSDYHGPGRGDSELGTPGIPLEWCEQLRQRAETHRAAGG